MMTWQPQDEPLRQLVQCLRDSLSGDPSAQKNAELMLKRASESPDFTNYLAYLVANPQQPAAFGLTTESYHVARSAAAIALKNNIKNSYKAIPDPNKTYVRSVILQGLQDPNIQIRNYSGSVITEVMRQGGIMAWPHLLASLISLVENKQENIPLRTQEGAMSALLKICEDNKRALDRDYGSNGASERPLTFLFPKLLEFTSGTNPIVKATALSAINVFLPDKSPTVMPHLDALLMRLFALASDPSNEVRKYVCRSFLRIAEISPEKILPHMEGLVNYTILQQQNQEDEDLALDAAEFWLCLGEDKNLCQALGPYLDRIVPVLLESMVWSEEDQFRLEGEQEDAEQEDRPEDIKPAFATTKGARLGGNANGDVDENGANGVGPDDDLDEGEIEESDDGYEDEDPEDMWNLRKCSAAALDVLASVFHQNVFEICLPYLKDNLNHPEWPKREAAVLAVGAIADGCMDVVQPHLPDLTQYLLSVLGDKEAVVRQITCWALGRYSGWAAHLEDAGRQQYFVPVMEALLTKMLDGNKRVQEAAASGFANLEEKAKTKLAPYTPVILQQFVKCFKVYKDRNMYILYDCIQTLAEYAGPSLKEPGQADILMTALLTRWSEVSDQAREMFPLLECLSYVAVALASSFAPFAEPIFTRCISIISQNLEETYRSQGLDSPDKDFLVTSLDLLSGIIQALGADQSPQLVSKSNPNLFQLLAFCMKDAHVDVRQSAYALLGDCAISTFPQMQPYLPTIMELLIIQLDVHVTGYMAEDQGFPVVNNACWSLGEISVRQKEGMADYADAILTKLAAILFNTKIPESLNENAAIAIGRLGIGCPDNLAPHLAQIAPAWLQAISRVSWTEEKIHAFWGFNKVILCNPQSMEKSLIVYFAEVSTMGGNTLSIFRDAAVKESFGQVIAQYRTLVPNFDDVLRQNLTSEAVEALRVSVM
ncbi:ARM repeat-containing protein [Tothia fuscella]|uniref:ARM repeat-containing protein n=1 Tax=Tothia fuscella TaxID=1048955 RepID=A0A9P4TZI7_9PEZI|nr:ARM repeat-containing protein [Tothia fuscella]